MSYEAVGKLVDLWMSDPGFRAQARKDPRDAARKAGEKGIDRLHYALNESAARRDPPAGR